MLFLWGQSVRNSQHKLIFSTLKVKKISLLTSRSVVFSERARLAVPHFLSLFKSSRGFLTEGLTGSFLLSFVSKPHGSETCQYSVLWSLTKVTEGCGFFRALLSKVTFIPISGEASVSWRGPDPISVPGCDAWPRGSRSAGITCLPWAGDGPVWYTTSRQLMNHKEMRNHHGPVGWNQGHATELWTPRAQIMNISICFSVWVWGQNHTVPMWN